MGAEPADGLGVERLARAADHPEALRIAGARVADAHHRAHRRRRREHVGGAVAREHVELLVRVEAALALVDELDRAEPPRAEQRRDARRPRPLPHPVEELALLHVVAVDELLVREEVAVRVEDPLGEPGGAGGVVELRRVVGQRVLGLERCRRTRPAARRRPAGTTCSTIPSGIRPALARSVTSTLASESFTRWRMPSSP